MNWPEAPSSGPRRPCDAKQYQDYFIEARRALSLESRAYPDVVGMANDVVRGLLFYLVLLLPFAFAMERLFLAGRRIETRLLGILAVFLGMFFLLRMTHPAFQIVFSPMVVLPRVRHRDPLDGYHFDCHG